MRKIDFSFVNQTNQKIPGRYFLVLAKKVLEKMRIKNSVELTLIITTSKKIKLLNTKYRGKNETTDVLSFPIDLKHPESAKGKIILGDIYICPQFIKKTTGEISKEILGFIFIHGMLHLLGYNHQTKKESASWQKSVEKITGKKTFARIQELMEE